MLLLDSTLKKIDFNSIISKGRVLCVNYSHLQNDLHHLEYLHPFLKKGLDKIVAISSISNIHHPHIASYFSDVVTLSDPSNLWLQQIKETENLNESLSVLSHHLKCQQLWVDGQVKKFWYQPVESQLDEFINLKKYNLFKHLGKGGVDWLTSLNKKNLEHLFNRQTELHINGDMNKNDYSFTDFVLTLKWYKLIPNDELRKALLNSGDEWQSGYA